MIIDRRTALGLIGGTLAPSARPAAACDREVGKAPGIIPAGKAFEVREAGRHGGLAALPEGGFLAGWNDDQILYGRYFEADGGPKGGRRTFLSDGSASSCAEPVIFGDGSAMLAWPGALRGDFGSAAYATFVSRTGAAPREPLALSAQHDDVSLCLSSRLEDETAIVVWRGQAPDAAHPDVRWRLVGADGKPKSPIRSIPRASSAEGHAPLAVQGLDGGGAVIAYYRGAFSDASGPAFALRVDAAAKPVGTVDFGVETGALDLAALGGDAFCAVSKPDRPTGKRDSHLVAQVFSADGDAGRRFQTNIGLDLVEGETAAFTGPRACATSDGRVLVIAGGAVAAGRGSISRVNAMLLSALGAQVTDPIEIASAIDPADRTTAAAARGLIRQADGTFVAYWRGAGRPGASYARRLQAV